jgi:hypothetical protein
MPLNGGLCELDAGVFMVVDGGRMPMPPPTDAGCVAACVGGITIPPCGRGGTGETGGIAVGITGCAGVLEFMAFMCVCSFLYNPL